ncbi:MAG: DUF4856 domain-containing protein [Bacteroidetes bacterium]|nr:DUF4856 domain-containing protein [Bacteroidota bacterium]
MKTNFKKAALLLSLTGIFLFSCKKEKTADPTPTPTTTTYTVPTTYNFASVDFTTSTQRLAMLAEITTYIKTTHSNTVAPILDAQKLKDMYANVNSLFTDGTLNTSGIQLKDKTGNAFGLQAEIEANFTDAVTASQNAAVSPTTTTASNGVSGKMISGTRYILVDTAGVEYKEFVEKGIMAGVFYYQATTILNNISTFDNTTVTAGRTAQEKAWDEAFGYFGVPVDFPTNVTGLKNWGSYCNSVSISLVGTTTVNATIMNAWLKGRAAISNKDDAGRNAARDIVVKTWEKVVAARFITYVKSAKSKIGIEPATVNHNLSEAVGFIRAFKYNSTKTVSDSDIDLLQSYFETGGSVNLHTFTTTNLDNAINKMAFLFSLDASLL